MGDHGKKRLKILYSAITDKHRRAFRHMRSIKHKMEWIIGHQSTGSGGSAPA
jgi:hypothetical protein